MRFGSDIRIRLRHGDVTLILIVINIAIYLLCLATSFSAKGIIPLELNLPLYASWTYTGMHPWTVVSYMFTHFSVLHLLFNMLWLYCFGTLAAQLVSRRAMTIIYIVSGLCGALLYLVASPIHWLVPAGSSLVGASAAVMGLMTLTAILQPDLPLNFMFVGTLRLKWVAVICILLAFLGLGGGNSGGVVAHVGGVLTGVVAGLNCRRSLDHIFFRLKCRRLRHSINEANTITRTATSGRDDDEKKKLDGLLDKIRTSGYASLSRKEREELQRISKNLDQ